MSTTKPVLKQPERLTTPKPTPSKPVAIPVIHAETKKPIANETIQVGYSPFKEAEVGKIVLPKGITKDAADLIIENSKNPKWKNYKGNYFVASKENSTIYVVNNKHQIIDSAKFIRGATKGDQQNKSDPSKSRFSDNVKNNSTTMAGRYAFKNIDKSAEQYKDYDTPFNGFYSDQYGELGWHGIYKGNYDIRKAILDDDSIKQKLFSYGCLNSDKEFVNKYQPAIGDSLFITKEPKGI